MYVCDLPSEFALEPCDTKGRAGFRINERGERVLRPQYAAASAEELDRRTVSNPEGTQRMVIAETPSVIKPEVIVAHAQSTGKAAA